MTLRSPVTTKRSGALDLFRIVFTLMVLWAHSHELARVDSHREIFDRLHLNTSWGGVGVDGFFLLSGYLIVQSWMRDPTWWDYIRKRMLRIVPGYCVAVVTSFVLIGIFAPAVPHFFRDSFHTARFWISIFLLDAPYTARAFPGNANNGVNGSLWTITYEFRFYLLVSLLGMAGIFRRRGIWLIITVAAILLMLAPSLQQHLSWQHALLIWGNPSALFRLLPIFLIGGCYALYRKEIQFRPVFAYMSAVALVILPFLAGFFETWLVLFGGYLLMYLASRPLRLFHAWHGMPDVSYGTYLYGWPVGLYIVWRYDPPFVVVFLTSAIICVCLGWLSWHFIERPMLRLKPGRKVEVGPA